MIELSKLRRFFLGANSGISYRIDDDIIYRLYKSQIQCEFSCFEVQAEVERLLRDIMLQRGDSGAFELPERKLFFNRFMGDSSFKAKATEKSDISIKVFDCEVKETNELRYCIKSMLGSPATILNSSKHTDFKYRIDNFCDEYMYDVNKIDTKAKLLDRINKIYNCGGKISFVSVPSDSFKSNLELVDEGFPLKLANALLYSYAYNEKSLLSAYCKSNSKEDEKTNITDLTSFLNAISFGFVPSKMWNGKCEVDGGLFIVKGNGDVVLLDRTKHSQEVETYLIGNTKFDSPSSSRYHMLEIFKRGSNYYFTLNLQLRYKK